MAPNGLHQRVAAFAARCERDGEGVEGREELNGEIGELLMAVWSVVPFHVAIFDIPSPCPIPGALHLPIFPLSSSLPASYSTGH
jgi:hypothetical protein